MRKCPRCGSSRIYPSRIKGFAERIRRVFSEKQPYRCHACNMRAWAEIYVQVIDGPDAAPDDLKTGLSARPITVDDLDRLDKN